MSSVLFTCDLCPKVNNCVPGSVPQCNDYTQRPIVFIGEAPGRDEDRSSQVFVGKTGQELNEHYLPLAGLRRDSVHIYNAIQCLPTGHGGKLDMGRQKDLELLLSCSASHLYGKLEQLKPRLIVPMGAFACYTIDPDINLELQHGIPLETSWGTVFPMYHPSTGLHEPKRMLLLRNDWVRLGKYLKGKQAERVDEYPVVDYKEEDIRVYAEGFIDNFHMPLACDTEITGAREPFCITYSLNPGSGRLIKATSKLRLEHFQCMLDKWTGPILFHNWLFDQHVVEAMGLRFPQHLIVDTMVRAYHLGNLPQGLKALAFRELGMTMLDFEDLVVPYSTPKCLEYLRNAYAVEWPKPEEQLVRDELGHWKTYKPQSVNTKLKRFFSDYQKNPNKSVFDAWDNWEESHDMIQKVMGPWPGKCITHAPFDEVVHYACRDADATIRLWYRLQGMTRKIRKTLQEHWGD